MFGLAPRKSASLICCWLRFWLLDEFTFVLLFQSLLVEWICNISFLRNAVFFCNYYWDFVNYYSNFQFDVTFNKISVWYMHVSSCLLMDSFLNLISYTILGGHKNGLNHTVCWSEDYLRLQKKPKFFFNSLGAKFIYCSVKWLLKWKDLDYEYATWELQSSSSKIDKVCRKHLFVLTGTRQLHSTFFCSCVVMLLC